MKKANVLLLLLLFMKVWQGFYLNPICQWHPIRHHNEKGKCITIIIVIIYDSLACFFSAEVDRRKLGAVGQGVVILIFSEIVESRVFFSSITHLETHSNNHIILK